MRGRGVEGQQENAGSSSMRKYLDPLHSYRELICCYQSAQLVLVVTAWLNTPHHIWNLPTVIVIKKITKKRPLQLPWTSLCKHLMHKTVKIPSSQTSFHQKWYKSIPAFTADLPSDKITFIRVKKHFCPEQKIPFSCTTNRT